MVSGACGVGVRKQERGEGTQNFRQTQLQVGGLPRSHQNLPWLGAGRGGLECSAPVTDLVVLSNRVRFFFWLWRGPLGGLISAN